MNILLSNDDGYSADGICILEQVLLEGGHHIAVAAPDGEQSGRSHAITTSRHVKATEYSPEHFHFSGTPADCIIYSHRCSLFPELPSLVISGINHGYNLSGDIIYSGTCAAARQAALYGVKAIAVSAESGEFRLLEKAALFVRDNLPIFMDAIPSYSFMNINIPASFSGNWERASVGFSSYEDDIVIVSENGNEKILSISGCEISRGGVEGVYPADSEVCSRGNASVSVIRCFPSIDTEGMENLF